MKKIGSLIILIILVLFVYCINIGNVSAATITLNNTRVGHQYEFYQIFRGHSMDGQLLVVDWGSGVNIDDEEFLNYLTEKFGMSHVVFVSEQLGQMQTAGEIKAFSKEIANYVTDPTAIVDGNDTDLQIDNLDDGYYLVKDVIVNEDYDSTYSMYVLFVTSEYDTIELKYLEDPTMVKKVNDVDDMSDYQIPSWADSADYSIGDYVSFQLSATIPSTIFDEYDEYKLIFHDFLSDGFVLTEYFTLFIDGKEIEDEENVQKYIVETDSKKLAEKESFSFEITDLISLLKNENITINGDVVVEVYYNAILDIDAISGVDGNINSAYLEYSSDPNGVSDTTDITPIDIVKVFTYNFQLEKLEAFTNSVLSGAKFALYNSNGDLVYEAYTNDYGLIEFYGIDAGDYTLEEVEAPAGYNKLTDPIEISILALHDLASDDPQLTSLLFNDLECGDGGFGLSVFNQKGTNLPETGGVGTIVFAIVGFSLMGFALFRFMKRSNRN